MRVYFLDTSALVKRYHREVGTDMVDTAFKNKEITRIVSDIGVIEFYSAFAKKVRTGEITREDFHGAIKEIAGDIHSGVIQLAFFGDNEKREAAVLIEKYGLSSNLRALDAMQFSVMKKFGSSVIIHVYCADRVFATLIEKEGFCVINPDEPPP